MQSYSGPGAGNPDQRLVGAEAGARGPWHLQTSIQATRLLCRQGDSMPSRGKLSSQMSQGLSFIHLLDKHLGEDARCCARC